MRSKTVDSNYTGRQISPEPNQRNSYYVLIYKERERKKVVCFFISHQNLFNSHQEIVRVPKQITHVGFSCKRKPSEMICCRKNNKTRPSRISTEAVVSLVSKVQHLKVF